MASVEYNPGKLADNGSANFGIPTGSVTPSGSGGTDITPVTPAPADQTTASGDKETTYVDADGNIKKGINRNGKTLDANGNEIQGGFSVKTADGKYWQKNADGTSTEIDEATYNASIKPTAQASAAEEAYQQAGNTQAGNAQDNTPVKNTASGNDNVIEVESIYQNTAEKPKSGYFDDRGKYHTTVYDAAGNPHEGYIYNGATYYADGKRLEKGGKVIAADGNTYVQDKDPESYDWNSDEFQGWLDNASGDKDAFTVRLDDYEFKGQTTDKWGQDVRNGNITIWPSDSITLYDGFQNPIGSFDSAGTFHPIGEGSGGFESTALNKAWEDAARQQLEALGYKFTGNGMEVPAHVTYPVDRADELWLQNHSYVKEIYPESEGWIYVANIDQLKSLPSGSKVYFYGDDKLEPSDFPGGLTVHTRKWGSFETTGDNQNKAGGNSAGAAGIPSGASVVSKSGKPGTTTYSGTGNGTGSTSGNSNNALNPLNANNYISDRPESNVPNASKEIQAKNEANTDALEALQGLVDSYGTDTEGLRQRLLEDYGTSDLDSIREMIAEGGTSLEFDYEDSDKYKQAEQMFQDASAENPELNFEEYEYSDESYEGKDLTPQINEIYDKNLTAATEALKNQLALGELDIDQALEKLPGIYEAGMTDMSNQYEISKRNANEYFAANGLSSGAQAQAMLAMNNVYQANLSAYRLEQANAVKDYENQRTRLKLEIQGKITEAMLENDAQRAAALLEEYQRQDEQGFQEFLAKQEERLKVWQQNCQNAVEKATFEQRQKEHDQETALTIMDLEERKRQENNELRLKEAEFLESQRQFTVSTGLDLAKIEETIRQNNINTEITIAELAQKDAQFKINANMTIAELAEKMRQFGIETDITLAELAEKARQFDISADQSADELKAKIAMHNQDIALEREQMTMSHEEFVEKMKRTDEELYLNKQKLAHDMGLSDKEFELTMRKFDFDNEMSTREFEETVRRNRANEDLEWAELEEKAREADLDYEISNMRYGDESGTSKKKITYDDGTYRTPPDESPSDLPSGDDGYNSLMNMLTIVEASGDLHNENVEELKSILREMGYDIGDNDTISELKTIVSQIYGMDSGEVDYDYSIYLEANRLLEDPEANDAINDVLDVINAPGYTGDPKELIKGLAKSLGYFEPGTRTPDVETMMDILEAINRDRK